jgi:CRISPR system Cascade subunit CasA
LTNLVQADEPEGYVLLMSWFSLLDHSWLPVRRAFGARVRIRPAELTSGIEGDPIVAVDWPRADLAAGARELLIGLLSTACWRQIVELDDWQDWWAEPPDADTLDARFAPFGHAFVLDGPGPRFLQDRAELDGEQVPVGALLIDTPGANALKKNTDLFVKRGRVELLSRAAAAIGLFSLNAYAPAGGAGIRTSLRGGGPLTTLLLPGSRAPDEPVPLWHQLWANVFWDQEWPDPSERPERVCPWLAPTRVSDKGQVTSPEDVHPAQALWGMPRRIRLDFETNQDGAPCDLTGEVDAVVVRTYRTRPHGTNYAAWSLGHPLTPYYRTKPTDPEWLPVHPQPGRLGYRDWVGLVLGDAGGSASTRAPAAAMLRAELRLGRMAPEARRGTRLHAAGYDMDNMKPRGFVESEMPVRLVAEAVRREYEVVVRELVLGAREAQGILSSAVRHALWDREAPGAGAGPRGLARERFWDETERPFHEAIADLADALEAAAEDDPILESIRRTRERWRDQLRRTVFAIFDALVPLDQIEERDSERLVTARRNLRSGLYGYGKSGAAFYAALNLQPPESKRKGSKAA